MKSVILIFFFSTYIFVFSPANAQSRLGKALDKDAVTSITSKKGIIYNGIDNILEINQSIISSADTILLQSNNGIIVKDTADQYLCIPQKVGTLWLTLHNLSNGDTTLIGYTFFSVENIPDPQLTINDRPITTPAALSKKTLLHCDSLGVFFSDDIRNSRQWMTITEFSIGYSYGGFYVSHTNPSNKLTKKTKELINRLGPEREISIRTVASSEGKVIKQLPIYRITIY